MGNSLGLSAIGAIAALLLAGCEEPPNFSGERIDGNYFLVDAIFSDGWSICYRAKSYCDPRIEPPVVSVGWDKDFISAAVRFADDPDNLQYYYIVRDFDGPREDGVRAVRGPYDEESFVEERRKHGVPGVWELAVGN